MVLCFASVCGIGALFYRIMRQTAGATTSSALVAWVPAMFLCFSGVQLENFLWGIQFEPFFPGLAVLGAVLVNTSGRSVAAKAVLNALLALVATYTFANGMFLWVLGTPIPSATDHGQRRRLYLSYGAYALAAAFAIGAYFVGYQHPGHHPQILPAGTRIAALLHYALLWIGSYFASPVVQPLAAGITTAVVLLGASVAALALLIRKREWRRFYPSFIITSISRAQRTATSPHGDRRCRSVGCITRVELGRIVPR
jgi:hypothetical protein